VIRRTNKDGWPLEAVAQRARLIIDDDFAGDTDGLVELAHHLLSPSVEIVGVIGTHPRPGDPWYRHVGVPAVSIEAARKVARLAGRSDAGIMKGAGPQHRPGFGTGGLQPAGPAHLAVPARRVPPGHGEPRGVAGAHGALGELGRLLYEGLGNAVRKENR
jgi:hypothetical protein